MKLSEYLNSGTHIHKRAKLKKTIKLSNKQVMHKGSIGSLVMLFPDGYYHFEHNNFACKVQLKEIEII